MLANKCSIVGPKWLELVENFGSSDTKRDYELSDETKLNCMLRVQVPGKSDQIF